MVDQFLWFVSAYGFQYLAVGLFIYFLATIRFGTVSFLWEVVNGVVYLFLWPIIVVMLTAIWLRKRAGLR